MTAVNDNGMYASVVVIMPTFAGKRQEHSLTYPAVFALLR
jgi:hypothetical protein